MVNFNPTVEEKVKALIVEHLSVEPDKVDPDARFGEDLDADSLDLVELIMAIEEEFGIEIPDGAAEEMKTVKDIVAFIQEKTSASSSSS